MADVTDLSNKLHDLRERLERLAGLLPKKVKNKSSKVDGFDRYCRTVTTELSFVQAMCDGKKEITKSRVMSSNVALLEAIYSVTQREQRVVAVGQAFTLDGKPRALTVDVVSEQGSKWVKVKAMSGKSIEDVHLGRGRFGEKSVVELAGDYLRCAGQNLINFGAPRLELVFTDLPGVPASIIQTLEAAGVTVSSLDGATGKPAPPLPAAGTTDATAADNESDEEEAPVGFLLPPASAQCPAAIDPTSIDVVNLDITSLVALCSELSHGGAHKQFPDHPVLQRQADDEAVRPVLATVAPFLAGKRLVVCDRSRRDFEEILGIVGGPCERRRGAALLSNCQRVPDQPSAIATSMPESRRVKERQKVIFGTGHALHAITLTANLNFVRAAQDLGFHFAVFVHPSRALTESKGEWPAGRKACEQIPPQLAEFFRLAPPARADPEPPHLPP